MLRRPAIQTQKPYPNSTINFLETTHLESFLKIKTFYRHFYAHILLVSYLHKFSKKYNKYKQVCKASGTNQWWPCNSSTECQGWAETVAAGTPDCLSKPSWQLVSEPMDLWGCFYYESHCSCLIIFTLTYYFEVKLLLCWDLAKVKINLNLSWWMLTCKLTLSETERY